MTFDHRLSLGLLRSEIAELNQRIGDLTETQWQQESTCPGWRIADLVMHVVRNGEAFLDFTKGVLAGDGRQARGFSYPDAQEADIAGPDGAPREKEIRELRPSGCAELQAKQFEEYAALVSGLSAADEDKTGWWGGGCQRTIRWGSSQRLVEVTYHHWDLWRSLGEDVPLPRPVARHVLAYRLDPWQSPMFRYRPADGAQVQAFQLRCLPDGATWRVSLSPEAVVASELGWSASARPRPGRRLEADASRPADIVIRGEVGWLALVVAGRAVDSEHLEVSGSSDKERAVAAFST